MKQSSLWLLVLLLASYWVGEFGRKKSKLEEFVLCCVVTFVANDGDDETRQSKRGGKKNS